MSSRSNQWFCDDQSVPPLGGHGDCGLVGGRVVWVCMHDLQTISAHPSIPNLVAGVDLATFLLPSGRMCHPQGAGRYLSGFGADPVFLRVFQGGIPTCWHGMWGCPAVVV